MQLYFIKTTNITMSAKNCIDCRGAESTKYLWKKRKKEIKPQK